MQKSKAMDVFIVAEQFRLAAKLMYELQKRDAQTVAQIGMPSIACAAFALELYLKSLLRLERKNVAGIHDLWKLFSALGRRNQGKIRKFWRQHSSNLIAHVQKSYNDAGAAVPKVDFDFALRASRLAFVKIRYVHEGGLEPDTGWLGDAIMEGARAVILGKHPYWETARQTTPLPTPGTQSTSQVR